jgi:tryptophanase
MGVPVMKPAGGHAVFVDARKMLPQIPPLQFPAHALAIALYVTGGIRSVEIGSLMFGRQPDGSEKPAAMDLVRLAMPRRVYTQSHADYIIECFAEVSKNRDALKGYEFTWEAPSMRHFTSRLQPLSS